jgi:adenylate cyclase
MDYNKKRPRLLTVDDNERNVKLLEAMLTPQGYEVIPAFSGPQALESVRQKSPDLIILDIVMPEMDGYEVTRIMRANPATKAIPILVVTALRETDDMARALGAGADDFLSKPFGVTELVARVRSLVRIKQLHDELQVKDALLERMLMRCLSEDAARQMLQSREFNLPVRGQTRSVSVLSADIRGVSQLLKQHTTGEVTRVLNQVLTHLMPLILEHSGLMDKYLGEAIIAFYGALAALPDNPVQAVQSAWKIQQRFAGLRQENPLIRDLGLGIGVHTGEALIGNVGLERSTNYTVISNAPSVARRLEASARIGQILIGESTYQVVKDRIEARPTGSVVVDGWCEPVNAYEVLAFRN